MLLPLGSITSRSIQRPMLPFGLPGSDSTALGSTALVAAEPPKSERVPSLAVTSHQYVLGLLPWRTIFWNSPSTRSEKVAHGAVQSPGFSGVVLRGMSAP